MRYTYSKMDTSWLDLESNNQDLDDADGSTLKLKERVDSITICSMYVDLNSTIIHTVTDPDVALDAVSGEESKNDLVSVLTCERLQNLIRDKCKVGSQHFHVEFLLLYHVNLMPEQVQVYVKTDTDTRFLKVCRYASTLPEFKDVVIPPAVPCFQDIHRIYIIFHEDVCDPRQQSLTTQGCDSRSLTTQGCDQRSRPLTTQGCDQRSRPLTTQGCDQRSLTKRVSFHDTSGRSKHRHTRKFRAVAESVAGLVSEPVAESESIL